MSKLSLIKPELEDESNEDTSYDPQHIRKELEDKVKEMAGAWSQQYQDMASDLQYLSGGAGMWDDTIYSGRSTAGRPCVSLPLSNPYVSKISGPIRANPPSIAVRTTDKKLQELVSGVLRGIERSSSAYEAYAVGIHNAGACGMGFLRVALEYSKQGNVIKIKACHNPLELMIDPYSREIDGSDAKYAVHQGTMELDLAKDKWGDDIGNTVSANVGNWDIPDGSVLDVTCYWLVEEGCKMVRYVGNMVVQEDLIPGLTSLPIIPIYGNQIFSKTGRRWDGVVSSIRDLNSNINITVSNVMEMVALAPKAPWLMDEESIGKHRDSWANANTEPYAYLLYKGESDTGRPLAPPTRMDNQPATMALQGVGDWMMSMLPRTTGISDAILGGLESAGESGVALIARMQAASGATAVYVDHLTTSITQMARVIIQLIPMVYNETRQINVVDGYGRSASVQLNLANILTPDVVDMLDVEIESGPNMELQRQAAADALQTMIAASGEKGIALMDLWAKNQNIPDADLLQERIKLMMPPEFQPKEEGQGALTPEVQEMLQQADDIIAQNDQLVEELKGTIAQLQAQVNSQHELAQVEKYKVDVNAEVTLRKTEMETFRALQVEDLKQGGSNKRLAAQLSADQQAEVDAFVKRLLEKKINEGSEPEHSMGENEVGETPKLPQYINDKIYSPEE